MKTIIFRALRNPLTYFVLASFAVFFYFRLVNLPERVIFDWDQENYANQIKDIVQNGNFTLLGPRTTHDQGFFLAPYFTYLMLPFYAAADLHPSGSLSFLMVVNALFLLIVTYILNKMFNLRFAILFILFWAINFIMVEYDTIPWWPVVIPLGIFSTFYLLYQIVHEKKWYWWALLGLNLGLFINMHFQFIFIIFFTGVFLLLHFSKKNPLPIKNIGIAIASFAVMFTPLFIFDLRNNFMNSKLFFSFFFGEGNANAIKTKTEWIPVLSNFLQPYTILKLDIITLLLYVAIGIAFFYLFRKAVKGFVKDFYLASLILWISVPLFFIYYAQRPSEYYFVFILPFLLIALIAFFIEIKFSRLLYVLLIVLAVNTYSGILDKWQPEPFGLAAKEKTARYIFENYDPKTFAVSFDVETGREPGFRYIMSHYGITTHNEETKNLPLIEVQIPRTEESSVKITDDIGLKVNPKIKKNGK